MAYFQEQMAQEEMADERWGDSMKQKMEFHELRHELKSVLMESLDATSAEKARIMAILKNAITEIRKKAA